MICWILLTALPLLSGLTVSLLMEPGLEAMTVPLLVGWLFVFITPNRNIALSVSAGIGVASVAVWAGIGVLAGCFVVATAVVLVVAVMRQIIGRALSAVILFTLVGWPVLLSRHLPHVPGWVIDVGVWLNPLLALSAVAREWVPWTQLSWVYPRTSLGQDVGYERPAAWLTVLIYGLMGAICTWRIMTHRRSLEQLAGSKVGLQQLNTVHPETSPKPEAGHS